MTAVAASIPVLELGSDTARLARVLRLGGLRARLLLSRLRRRPFSLRLRYGGVEMALAIAAARELRRAADLPLEAALVQRMREHLRAGDTVFDIGANIGLITLALAADRRADGCRFHCFEPEPRNFRQLSANLRLNGLEACAHPHRMALGDRDGEAELFVRGGPGEGRHSMATRRGASGSIHVPLRTAASFCAGEGVSPDVVKIDVEGAEGFVLAGFEPLLATAPPRELFMEIHPKGLGDRMPDGRDLGEWLQGYGYRLDWQRARRSGVHRHYRHPGLPPVSADSARSKTPTADQ